MLSKEVGNYEELYSPKILLKWLMWGDAYPPGSAPGYNQWWDLAGSHRFYRTVSGNFIRTANRLALLLILVPIVETELADNITSVIEPADEKFESHHWL